MKELKLDEAGAFLTRNQHVAKVAGITVLIVAMSAWTSCSAREVTRQADAELRDAVAIRETATRFAQQFVPATSGETDEWSRTTEQAAEFGAPEGSRLSLAQMVMQIAEVAGMSGVKASFTPTDSVGVADTRVMGEMTFQPAPYGLRLEGSGTVADVARTVLRLPPAVEITSLALSGTGQLSATFHLAVYQPAGAPQN